MRRFLRRVTLAVLNLALAVALVGYWLLVAWQVFVAGIAGGLRDALAVAAAGTAAGVALIVAHELGHALAAWAVGLLPLSATLVFVRVEWTSGRVVLRPNLRLFERAGVVRFLVAGAARWRVSAVLVAGPATNLVLAGMCFAAAAVFNPGPPADLPAAARGGWREMSLLFPEAAAVAWLNVTGLVGFYLGVVNLIPGREGKLRSDGGQLLDLMRSRRPTGEPATSTGGAGEPLFHLVLVNDDTHSYGYVIGLLQSEFGLPSDTAVALTYAVDKRGRAVVFTGTQAEVEARRDRVLAAGPDPAVPASAGPLRVQVEPA